VVVHPERASWDDVPIAGELMRPRQLTVTVAQEGDAPPGIARACAVGPKVCRGGTVSGMAQHRKTWPGDADLASAPGWVHAAAEAALASVAAEALQPAGAQGPGNVRAG
jgi:hypothetical protein